MSELHKGQSHSDSSDRRETGPCGLRLTGWRPFDQPKGTHVMIRRGSTYRRRAATLAVFCLALAAGPATATDWLVFLVDRSNSIDPEELRLQREAYVRLLNDDAVIQALSDTQVAIVEFDSRTELVTGWTSAQGAAQRYSRKAPDGLRGQTGIAHAVERALALLAGKQGRMVIDISGDGVENVDRRLLIKVRRKASEREIEINGLAIDNDPEVDLSDYYLQNVATGFVLPVERREDFYEALRNKLFLEVVGREAPPDSLDAAADRKAVP